MPYARKVGGSWQELTGPFTIGDLQYPADWPEHASAPELAALGIKPITEAGPEPVDVAVTGTALAGDDLPHRVYVTRPFTPEELADLKARLIAQVNSEAGAFRSRFITAIPGQETTYLLKEQEARAFVAASGAGSYPYLEAEAAATGMTTEAVANLVIQTADLWRSLDPPIEGRRRGASVAIEAATTASAALAAAVVDWDSLVPS